MIENDNEESAKGGVNWQTKIFKDFLRHTSVILDIIIIAMMAQIL
ncbi:MAG: hypothetical protein ACLU8S_03220 [Coprococcus phoceensis]